MPDLRRFLADYDMAMLRAVAQARGLPLTSNRQTEAADQLAVALLDPLSVRTAVAQLSEGGQQALLSLIGAGGKMRSPLFMRRFGQVRPIGPGRLEREAPWRRPASPAEELHFLGLVYRGFERDEAGPGEFHFVPDDMLPLLPAPEGEPQGFSIEPESAPALPRDSGFSLVQDLFSYLVYLQLHDVRPYADGRLGRRDLAELRVRLSDPGERRLSFLRHLALRLGFVVRKGDLMYLDPTPVKAWLVSAPEAQSLGLAEAWRDDPTWNDLRLVPGLAFDEETARPLRNDPVASRRAILALLARCPREAWWSAASFVSAVKAFSPDFQRPDGDYGDWFVHDAATGDPLSGFESWDLVEGALVTDLLTGALFWLGVVALASSASGPVCRLTDAGARFLGLERGPESLPAALVRIGPDMRVEVPSPPNLYTRFQLERFADLESTEPCRYRLTVSALGRALARGLRVDQVLAFLQQASEQSVPANVPDQLRLWAGRYDSVQLEETVLVRATSERILKELQMLPETRALIEKVVTPTTALVLQKDLPRLRHELRALGYLRPSMGHEAESQG